jgi:uncharacterized protein YjbI with pentapeptide repeats
MMDIKEILEAHKLWLHDKGGSRADLRGVDLRGVDLRGVDLRRADLRGADLRGVDLRGADLRRANLRGADLRGANLSGANLSGANLRGVDLRGADLRGADLREIEFNYCVGDGEYIKSAQIGEYKLAIKGDICCGGCTTMTLDEWLDHSVTNISDSAYLETVTKPFIRMIQALEGEEL